MNRDVFKAKLDNCENRINDVIKEINRLKTAKENFDRPGYFEFDVFEAYVNTNPEFGSALIHIGGSNFTISEVIEIRENLGNLIKLAENK